MYVKLLRLGPEFCRKSKKQGVWWLCYLLQMFVCTRACDWCCSWIIRRAGTYDAAAAACEIKYCFRGLTAGISLVFLEYQGSIFMFSAKTTSRDQQQWGHSCLPQLVQVFEDLLLGDHDRAQLLLTGSVQLQEKYDKIMWTCWELNQLLVPDW